MTEEIKTKSQAMLEEIANLKAALQLAAGGLDEGVQAVVARMEEILQPAA